ncbi:hypothetical protein EMIT0158MI4_170148 [Burkholderia ambifaria]
MRRPRQLLQRLLRQLSMTPRRHGQARRARIACLTRIACARARRAGRSPQRSPQRPCPPRRFD